MGCWWAGSAIAAMMSRANIIKVGELLMLHGWQCLQSASWLWAAPVAHTHTHSICNWENSNTGRQRTRGRKGGRKHNIGNSKRSPAAGAVCITQKQPTLQTALVHHWKTTTTLIRAIRKAASQPLAPKSSKTLSWA